MIYLSSKKTKELDTYILNQIWSLKNSHWTYGLNSQEDFFKKKIRRNDIHNLLLFKDKLIGYTCLRFINYTQRNKKKFLYFDTLIIRKSYRGKGLSKIFMNFNNFIIYSNNISSFLVCKNQMVPFYKSFFWKKNIDFVFKGIKPYDNCLSFNYNRSKQCKKKIIINL